MATPRRGKPARPGGADGRNGRPRSGRIEQRARSHAERADPGAAVVDAMERRHRAATAPAAQLPRADDLQQPAADQVVFTAAADAAPVKPTASLQKLLIVMAAALALAGLTVSAIVRIGRMRARRAMRRKRRAMWDSAKTANKAAKTRRRAPQPQQPPQPVFRDEDAVVRRAAAVQQHARVPQQEKAPTRPPRERPQQERPYAPQERRHAPQDRVPQQQRVSQDRAAPPDRDRERQVTEMLSRLARTAHS